MMNGMNLIIFKIKIMGKRIKMDKIKNIENMEKILNNTEEIFRKLQDVLDKLEKNQNDYKKLSEYYGSEEWFSDVEDSNNNLLPKDLKCGVLSEDAVYDLISDNHRLAVKMLEIATEMVRRD